MKRWGTLALLGLLAAVVGTMVVSLVVTLLFFGEDDQYGRVAVPGTAELHLPAGSVNVNFAVFIVGRGNQTPDVPIPASLGLSVDPPVTIRRSLGISDNSNDRHGTNAQRRVYKLDVPADGDYRVTARGSGLVAGPDAQLWFGHHHVSTGLEWVIGAVVGLLGLAFIRLGLPRLRR